MTTQVESILTPELKKWIGYEKDNGVEVVEAGAIKRFADAIKDPNPLWRVPEYAAGTPHGGVIAPPTFMHCLRSLTRADIPVGPFPWKNSGGFNGGNEFELYQPMRPGDVLTGKARVADIYVRETKSLGPMIVVVSEMTCTNQRGELVALQRTSSLRYELKDKESSRADT